MPPAIVFDLDGTLTVSHLDFDAIRADIGLAAGPILEAMAAMSASDRRAAEVILERHERLGSESAVLQPGAAETVRTLRARGHAVGVLTRNARRWSELILRRFEIEVDALRCREDEPIKPNPQGLLAMCDEFGTDPRMSWMVGDHAYDIETGRRAGCKTALLVAGDAQSPDGHRADVVIHRLDELLDLVGAPKNT